MPPPSPRYLLDSNAFIQPKNQYYAFDLCPGYWDFLAMQHEAGAIKSIDRVLDELRRGKDELADWALTPLNRGAFLTTDRPDVIAHYAELQVWAQGSEQYRASASVQFAQDADAWLVAAAKALDSVLVTHERHSPEARGRIPLPNACRRIDVRYCTVFDMLRSLGARFHLAG